MVCTGRRPICRDAPSPREQGHPNRAPGLRREGAYLPEGHFYLRITIKVELSDSFSIFQDLHRCQLLGLSLLSGRKKLDVGAREDPHPAVMLSFIPVLINLLVDVHNVPLLQRKLPVDRRSEHVSRCLKMCKMKTLHFLAKGDSE